MKFYLILVVLFSQSSFAHNCAEIIASLSKIEISGIKVDNVISKSDGSFTVQIKKEGLQGFFYAAMSLPNFILDFPEVSNFLGFKVIHEGQKRRKRYASDFVYEIPDIETLNKRVTSLRARGVLPDNGLHFVYVSGVIKYNEYVEMFAQGKIPVSYTDQHFFHDVNVHILSALMAPRDIVELFLKDLLFFKSLGNKKLLYDSTFGYDNFAIAQEPNLGFPNFDGLASRANDLNNISHSYRNHPQVLSLKAEYLELHKKYSGKNLDQWLDVEISKLKNLKIEN